MAQKNSSKKPNIITNIVHDIGQHLGCYEAGLETPNLDKLAQTGVRFDNYLCTAAQCSPSRGSIMTGKYPHRNGLVGLAHIGWEINNSEKKLPEYLNEAGYETYLFGTQHETANPKTLGYKYIPEANADAKEATRVFTEHAPELSKSEDPFYASIGFDEPHRPYNRPGYKNDLPDKVTVLPWLPDKSGIREDIGGLNGLVYEVDRCVGEIMKCLKDTGLWNNTLFIFTTDHGIAMPRAKGTCYDPGVKTALIMNFPGRIEGGKVYTELLSNVDFLPTILEIAGAGQPEGIDGRSFLPLLEGRNYRSRHYVYLEMTWHDRYNPMRAVRTDRYKYIRNFGNLPLVYLPEDVFVGTAGEEMRDEYYASSRPEEELYDLESDPLEMKNVAGDEKYKEILRKFRNQVQKWMEDTNDRLLKGDWPPSEKQAERERTDKTPNAFRKFPKT